MNAEDWYIAQANAERYETLAAKAADLHIENAALRADKDRLDWCESLGLRMREGIDSAREALGR